jgi:hypothetical protein
VLDPSVVSTAPPPGRPGKLRYAGGNDVRVGQIIAISVGRATPEGFLGQATKVASKGGRTIVSTRPATLLQAIPSGSLNATLNLQSASATGAPLRLGAHTASLSGSCTGGHTLSVNPNVSFNAGLSLASDWSPFGGLKSASLTARTSANASVKASISGAASCTLNYKLPLPKAPGPYVFFVGWVPVVLTVDWSLPLDLQGSVNASTSASASAGFSASAGIGWTNSRGFYPIGSFSSHFGYTPPSITANASLGVNVTPTLYVLLYGVVGPKIALKSGVAFNADITKNPWWTLTAPIDLTASLTIKQLNLTSPSLHVYRHTFPIAQACGPFGASCGLQPPTPHASVTVTNPGDQTGTVGTPASLQIQASDTDGGRLSYSAAGLPAGLSINSSTGLISGTPTSAGSSSATVTATDATGPSGQTSFTWTINPGGIPSGPFIYWDSGSAIGRANLDGSSPNANFISGIETMGEELAVDSSHLYWVDGSVGGGAVGRANLDGSGVDETFIPGGILVRGVAVDPSYVYWSNDYTAPSIQRANLDGSGATTLVGGPASGYIAVDGSHVYWTGESNDAIGRANLDGSNPTRISSPASRIPALRPSPD